MDAKEYLKESSKKVDKPIKSYIEDQEPMRLIEASRQYPYAGGKRMRPVIVLAACGAVGGDKKKAMPLAVAIEYIHNFTLIHDDIMDGDSERRGMTTIHVAYDVPTAILAGDALFAKAFQIIADLDVPTDRIRDILRYVTKAVWDLARGQEFDTMNEGKFISEKQYLETIKLKTSVLFAAAAAGGAIAGGADKKTVENINKYALAMGLGFQMFDDYLGIMGDTSKTGKSVGNDIRKGKCTLMVTYT
ncbi:MAG: polyprenyl synthetase family protein, partial [Candidatus Methanomethylophilus sp.]|nr:polyprenyl synthetase family protein [Methanomethylophilus sp.]